MSRYSRRRNVEEKRNIRKAYLYIVISAGLLLAMVFYGIPLLSNLAIFTANLRSSNNNPIASDTTPPPPPNISDLPEFTNETQIEVRGNTEEGALVTVYLGTSEKEILANKQGQFVFTLNLSDGKNTFYVKATDTSGNESQPTQEYTVVFDDEEPELEITGPSEREFFGQNQRQVEITGQTESGVDLTINDRFVVINPNGSFVFSTSLVEGENRYTIRAKDDAGNETKDELVLNFSP